MLGRTCSSLSCSKCCRPWRSRSSRRRASGDIGNTGDKTCASVGPRLADSTGRISAARIPHRGRRPPRWGEWEGCPGWAGLRAWAGGAAGRRGRRRSPRRALCGAPCTGWSRSYYCTGAAAGAGGGDDGGGTRHSCCWCYWGWNSCWCCCCWAPSRPWTRSRMNVLAGWETGHAMDRTLGPRSGLAAAATHNTSTFIVQDMAPVENVTYRSRDGSYAGPM